MRRALKIALPLLLPYPLLFVGFYIAMLQSPEVFSGVMSKTSNVAFKSEAGPFGFKTDPLSKALESVSKP